MLLPEGMFGRWTSYFAILLTLISATTVAVNECRSLTSSASAVASPGSISHSSADLTTVASELGADHASDSEDCCHHSGPCRQCHVSPAQFAVVVAESLALPAPSRSAVIDSSDFALSATPHSLLRPPRA